MRNQLGRQLADRSPEPVLRAVQRARHAENPFRHSAARRADPGRDEVVTSFDAHSARRETAAAVRAALDAHAIGYLAVPAPRGETRELAVAAEDRDRAREALAASLPTPPWEFAALPSRRRSASPGLLAFRRLVAPNGGRLGGSELAVRVTFWAAVGRADSPRPDGGQFSPDTRLAPTPNGLVGYLTGAAWARGLAAPNRWASNMTTSIFEVREPVDVVYTWVDGDDPAWLARKDAYRLDGSDHHASADARARFVSRDELRYSLRSVATFASWARRVFLVTDGQVPSWLDTTHPQLEVVDHRQVFRDPSALPVFNSHAIEAQLHHIPGLSEHYLYLNDDVFFGRLVEPELFFHGNGIAKFFRSPDTIDLDPRDAQDLPVMSAAKNHRDLLASDFGVRVTAKFQHGGQPQLRSVLEEMEQRYPQLFAQVGRSRFRHPDDLSIASALHHYYAFAIRRAVPGDMDYRYQDITAANTPRRLDAIRRHRPQVFCLNDIAGSPDDDRTHRAALADFFADYFPLPSPFERLGS
jgi:hypothetical protein